MLTPFPLLSKLRVNDREKAILIVIFLLPIFVIAFPILRLVVTNAEGTTIHPIRLALFRQWKYRAVGPIHKTP